MLIALGQSDNGLDFSAMRKCVVREGYKMPRIDAFMTHYCNVRDAALGKTELYDGNSRKIENKLHKLGSLHKRIERRFFLLIF